jgi:hypothetical protein
MLKKFLRNGRRAECAVLLSAMLSVLAGCGGGDPVPPVQSVLTAPVITSQPAGQTVVAGAGASFSVAATGSAPLTYQWQRNGVNIAGAGSSTYTVGTALLPDDGAGFTAKVSSAGGTTVSSGATLSVQPTATMSLVAGTVTAPSLTPYAPGPFADGPTASARFGRLTGLAVDSGGNLFVTDTFNQVVRKISAAGQVSTFAGTPGVTQPGTNLGFFNPGGLAIDSADTLYLADGFPIQNFGLNWFEVKAVSPQGVISSFYRGTVSPASLAVDAARNVYIPGVRISPAGVASGIDLSAAPRHTLYGLAMGADGTFYFALDNTIWKNPPGFGSQVLAGAADPGEADGLPQQARFKFSAGSTPQFQAPMVADSAGNLYLSDDNNIRKVSKDGFVTTLTGRPGMIAGVGVGDLADKPISSGALAMRGDKALYFTYSGAVFKLELR